jgi:iron complex transport system permease protein
MRPENTRSTTGEAVSRRKGSALTAGNLVLPVLLAALLILSIFSVAIGRYPLSLSDILRVLFLTPLFNAVGDYSDTHWVVIKLVRLPRIFLVSLCGMGLGLAGAAMQGVFRNPLVGPEIIGVSAGASLGGVLAIMLSFSPAGTVAMAFAFGLLALTAAFGTAKLSGQTSTLSLVLAGVIVGAFFSALVGLMQYWADPQTKLPSIIYWLLGSFVGASYAKVMIVAGIMLCAGTPLMLLRWRINLLSLGETDAKALGVHIELLRWVIVALAALIVAAQVSVSGGVHWVGLIIPHLARILAGPEHTRLLPASALLGGIYLLAMDDIARSTGSQEIPIGLLTAVIGAPAFAFLLWKMKARGWNRD